jgi:hypothetical protein
LPELFILSKDGAVPQISLLASVLHFGVQSPVKEALVLPVKPIVAAVVVK